MTTYKTTWVNTDYMTAVDMNRIESNIQSLASFLRSIYYNIPAITVSTSRDRTSVDFIADINRIEQNLETIRKSFITPLGYLGTMAWNKQQTFDFNDANRLEINTQSMSDLAVNVQSSFVYCGNSNAIAGGGGIY